MQFRTGVPALRQGPATARVNDASMARLLTSCALVLLLGACSGALPGNTPPPRVQQHLPKHVVVIVQENRTVDHLFAFLPGADTQNYGLNSRGQRVPLVRVPLSTIFDPAHSHVAYVTEFNNGAMNGFDRETFGCPKTSPFCGPIPPTAYAYVAQQEVQPYYTLAEQFAFADHVLQSNSGPSYPAHEYLVGGQSGRPLAIAENAAPYLAGGCSSPGINRVAEIDLNKAYPGLPYAGYIYPCIDFPTIFDLLDGKGLTWKYYAPGVHGLWTAPNGIRHIYNSPEFARNVQQPETRIFSDVSNHTLADVTYVVPTFANSDHPSDRPDTGPGWVASVVNAIGTSSYWNDTAVIVVWDDWGGWYDHYRPYPPLGAATDPYEYGFRVPLIAISPYARPRFVDHGQRDFTAILHFIEDVYGLPSLGQLDAKTDDLFSMFDFNAAAPLRYTPVPTNGFERRATVHGSRGSEDDAPQY
jgi:phospholipase C